MIDLKAAGAIPQLFCSCGYTTKLHIDVAFSAQGVMRMQFGIGDLCIYRWTICANATILHRYD